MSAELLNEAPKMKKKLARQFEKMKIKIMKIK